LEEGMFFNLSYIIYSGG